MLPWWGWKIWSWKTGQFSVLRIYYFFVLLMYSSCLKTFSDMKYWIADKTNMGSDFPQCLPKKLEFRSVCIGNLVYAWILRFHHQQHEGEGTAIGWKNVSDFLETCSRNLGLWDGFYPTGMGEMGRDAWHMQQTPDQVLMARQPVAEQENIAVPCCC